MSEVLSFKSYADELEAKGYRCTYYGNTEHHHGLAYYETGAQVLRIEYTWDQVGKDHYTAGHILSIEDVTSCYR